MSDIKILSAVVYEPLKEKSIEDTLKAKQDLVGGYIQSVEIYLPGLGSYVDLIVNEEGKLMGLPTNFYIASKGEVLDVIVGNAFFVGFDDSGDYISLTENEIDELYKMFSSRVRFNID